MPDPKPLPRSTATKIDGQVIYTGRIFRLEVDRVRLPAGHEVRMEIVRHPGSVVLLPIPAPGRIILVRQYRYTLNRWIWELPAGSLKAGEDPALAAARECEEEVGLAPGRVERVAGFFPTPGFCDEEMVYYRCLALAPPAPDSTAQQDEDEDLEPHEFAVADARAMAERGEIIDLKTVYGLTLL